MRFKTNLIGFNLCFPILIKIIGDIHSFLLHFKVVYDIMEIRKPNEVMDLRSHLKKMLAPIIISVIIILYFVTYFGLLIFVIDGIWKYALGIIPLLLSLLMVKVCIERIKEINRGEEDDLSKY